MHYLLKEKRKYDYILKSFCFSLTFFITYSSVLRMYL